MASALLTNATAVANGTSASVKGPATVAVFGDLGSGLISLKARYGSDAFTPIDDQKVIDREGIYQVDMVGTFDIRADLIRVGHDADGVDTEVSVSVQGS